jgi:Polyketide cyclase / dehydrase and lipid transport
MSADTYVVQRNTIVNAPAERIFAQLNDFHNWRSWSPWEGLDPELRRTYTGPDAGPGATYAWSGNRKAGQGHMTIIDATPSSAVVVDLVFEKPFPNHAESVFTITPQGAGSEVTWTMTGKKTLMTKIMGIFMSMDSLIGKDFDKGLAGLKAAAEE